MRCWLERMFRSWSVIPAPEFVSGSAIYPTRECGRPAHLREESSILLCPSHLLPHGALVSPCWLSIFVHQRRIRHERQLLQAGAHSPLPRQDISRSRSIDHRMPLPRGWGPGGHDAESKKQHKRSFLFQNVKPSVVVSPHTRIEK
jgi:hypothetical protein